MYFQIWCSIIPWHGASKTNCNGDNSEVAAVRMVTILTRGYERSAGTAVADQVAGSSGPRSSLLVIRSAANGDSNRVC
jgi:hypothetical protein